MLVEGEMAEDRGDMETALQKKEQITVFATSTNKYQYKIINHNLSGIYSREWGCFDLVLGFLQLDSNIGQFAALERLEAEYGGWVVVMMLPVSTAPASSSSMGVKRIL